MRVHRPGSTAPCPGPRAVGGPMRRILFAGIGSAGLNNGQYLSAILLVLGVFSGSCLWWIILCGLSNMFRYNLDYKKLGWVNKFAGVVLFIFGVFVLYSIL